MRIWRAFFEQSFRPIDVGLNFAQQTAHRCANVRESEPLL